MHYDMRWGWDIEQSRSKGWVIRKLVWKVNWRRQETLWVNEEKRRENS